MAERNRELREDLHVGAASASVTADGGKGAAKLDKALGGGDAKRGRPQGPVGVSTGETFGQAAGAAAAEAQARQVQDLLAAFED